MDLARQLRLIKAQLRNLSRRRSAAVKVTNMARSLPRNPAMADHRAHPSVAAVAQVRRPSQAAMVVAAAVAVVAVSSRPIALRNFESSVHP